MAGKSARRIEPVDEIDRQILRLLQEDVTIPLVAIAGHVGLSQTPCWKRIRRLIAMGVIEKRVAILSPEAVGMRTAAFIEAATGDDPALSETVAAEIAAIPEVMELYRVEGSADLLLRILVADDTAYEAFVRHLTRRFPGVRFSGRRVDRRIKSTTAIAGV